MKIQPSSFHRTHMANATPGMLVRDMPSSRSSQVIYQRMIDLSPESILVCTDDSLSLINEAGCRMLGTARKSEILGLKLLEFISPAYHSSFHEQLREAACNSSSTAFVEQEWKRKDGTVFPAEVAMVRLARENGDMSAVQLFVRDISERKRRESIQAAQNRILNMIATDAPLSRILHEIIRLAESGSPGATGSVSQLCAARKTLMEPIASELPPTYLARIARLPLAPGHGSCATAAMHGKAIVDSSIASDPIWRELRGPALSAGFVACSSWPIFNRSGKTTGTLALYYPDLSLSVRTDVRLCLLCAELAGVAIERRNSYERIRYLAHYDGLTSLPNRFLFQDHLDLAIRDAERRQQKCAVLFIDLDRFKEINDTLGHDAGDQVLREIAARLRACLRHRDRIARMGGDEFYVLIEELRDGRHAADVALKLLDAARRPFQIQDREFHLSASIGISVYPDDGMEPKTLLESADNAMYCAKRQGKNGYRFYSTPTVTCPDSSLLPDITQRTALSGLR